jgi:WD40 repeat protein
VEGGIVRDPAFHRPGGGLPMTTIYRSLLTISVLCCLSLLATAADDEKKTTITVTPSVFLRQQHTAFEVALSPDGKTMGYQPHDVSHGLHLLDVATKKILHRLPFVSLGGVTFTPDGTRLVCLRTVKGGKRDEKGWPPFRIDIHDVKTGKLLREIPLAAGQPGSGGAGGQAPPFGVSNEIVVVGGRNEVATAYDLKTGNARGDLPGKVRVTQMALSRDGRWLLASEFSPPYKPGEPRGTVHTTILHTWDVKARKYDRRLYEHISHVMCVAISPDGRWCAFGTMRGIKVFDRTTGGEKTEGRSGLARARSIAFSADGKRIVAAHSRGLASPDRMDLGLRFWDWQTEDPPISVVCPFTPEVDKAWRSMGSFQTHVMSSDGNRFLSITGSQGLLLLDLKNPNPPPEKKPEEKPNAKK